MSRYVPEDHCSVCDWDSGEDKLTAYTPAGMETQHLCIVCFGAWTGADGPPNFRAWAWGINYLASLIQPQRRTP